jgi:hypothetical protein
MRSANSASLSLFLQHISSVACTYAVARNLALAAAHMRSALHSTSEHGRTLILSPYSLSVMARWIQMKVRISSSLTSLTSWVLQQPARQKWLPQGTRFPRRICSTTTNGFALRLFCFTCYQLTGSHSLHAGGGCGAPARTIIAGAAADLLRHRPRPALRTTTMQTYLFSRTSLSSLH